MSAPRMNRVVSDFAADATGDKTIRLKDLRGQNVVIYFYPKDSTPGCTQEAQDFRDLMPKFKKLKTPVIGVSKDSVKRHDNFKAKNELNFMLISDEDGSTCEAYGTWIQKKLYGREYMGIDRSTFLIDGKGVIRNIWRKVKVAGHAEAVLEAVGEL